MDKCVLFLWNNHSSKNDEQSVSPPYNFLPVACETFSVINDWLRKQQTYFRSSHWYPSEKSFSCPLSGRAAECLHWCSGLLLSHLPFDVDSSKTLVGAFVTSDRSPVSAVSSSPIFQSLSQARKKQKKEVLMDADSDKNELYLEESSKRSKERK